MKTKTTELRVLYEDPTPQIGSSFSRSISTMHGDLMTSRLRAMISTHGERVQIPNMLVWEIVRNRDKLSRRLKVTQRELSNVKADRDLLDDALNEMVSILLELMTSSAELCDAISEEADEATIQKLTDKLEAVRDILNCANGMFDEDDEDCDCGCECD